MGNKYKQVWLEQPSSNFIFGKFIVINPLYGKFIASRLIVW